jgi:GntR family transcriptional regulator
MVEIDRSSAMPFYFQLKQILIGDIRRRGLQPGDRMEGEHELCEEYGVSRTVVRQALSELEAEGIVERLKGRGTFVARQKTPEGLVKSLTGLFEEATARGARVHSDVRRLEIVPADEQVASSLEIERGESVVLIERLRYVDDEPWVLTVTQLPSILVPGLVNEDLRDKSLYTLLEDKYNISLRRASRSVEAAVAGDRLARCLGIDRSAAVLVLRSIVRTTGDRPVELFVAYHRGDRSRFDVELDRLSSMTTADHTIGSLTLSRTAGAALLNW